MAEVPGLEPQTTKISPLTNAGTSAAAGGVGAMLGGAIIAANPELGAYSVLIMAACVGVLGGVGNAARSQGGWLKAIAGWF